MVDEFRVVGLNHQTAPVELRESLVKAIGPADDALKRLASVAEECVVLSTCNRLEVYLRPGLGIDPLVHLAPNSPESIRPHIYDHRGADGITHLMEVTASLNSLVIGETQILGQVRDAYEQARVQGTVGKLFHAVFQSSLEAAKDIHSTTGLAHGHVSVGSVAVDLCRQVWERIDDRRIVLVGSGTMGTLVLDALLDAGARNITLTSRTRANADALAGKKGAAVIDWEHWHEILGDADVIVTAVDAPEPILDRARLAPFIKARGYRPLLIVDISLPRNVATDVDDLNGVYRHDLDGLGEIIRENSRDREQEAHEGHSILARHAAKLLARLEAPDHAHLFRDLDQRCDTILEAEFERIKHQLPEDQHEVVREAMRRMGNKMLHPLRAHGPEVTTDSEHLRKLFLGNKT